MKTNEFYFHREFIELVKEAMNSNISKEDFKIFIESEKKKQQNH